jgi:aspartate aminotransferase
MPRLSSRLSSLPYSGVRRMMDLAMRTPGALRLEAGDPDLMTPRHITESTLRWAAASQAGYPPTAGLPELRSAIAHKLSTRNGLQCVPDQIVVTVGATGALYLSLLATIAPDDEVLVPDPGWAGYPAIVAVAGGTLVGYELDPDDGFNLSADAVRAATSERTRAIILNTPNNPTGAVYAKSDLEDVLALAEERDLWIITDECYEDIVFGGEHHSLGALEDGSAPRTLSVFSFSKTYAMTAWRVGYVAAPAEVADAIVRLQSPVVASTSGISQRAALEALTGPQEPVQEMADIYRRRRDLAVQLLDAAGLDHVQPQGTFYVMLDVRAIADDSAALAIELLRDVGVSTTPGSAFGPRGEGFLRISLACDDDDLREGLSRIAWHLAARR